MGRWVHSRSFILFGWAPRGRQDHWESLGSFGYTLVLAGSFGFIRFIRGESRGRWVHWGSGLIPRAPMGRPVHSGSLGYFVRHLGVIGFIQVRSFHSKGA